MTELDSILLCASNIHFLNATCYCHYIIFISVMAREPNLPSTVQINSFLKREEKVTVIKARIKNSAAKSWQVTGK